MSEEKKDYGPQLANMLIDTSPESEYFDARAKMTLRAEDAVKLVNRLNELIEGEVEKINITAFLKASQYGEGNYYGNLKIDEVGAQRPAKAFKPKASKAAATAKLNDAKDRIQQLTKG